MSARFDTSDSGQMEMSVEALQNTVLYSVYQKQYDYRPTVLITTDNFILENTSEHNHLLDSIKCNLLPTFFEIFMFEYKCNCIYLILNLKINY